MNARVLLVSATPQTGTLLGDVLVSRGFDVRTAVDADAAVRELVSRRPSVVVADPGRLLMDAADLCRRLRRASTVPIVVVTSEDDREAEVAAFDAGADDYIVKPFGIELLLARMRVAIRRGSAVPESVPLGVGEFQIDFDDRRVRVHGEPVRLTPKEFDLFVFMARHPNRVLAHSTLLHAVWGEGADGQSEYLRVFVGQLRKKLESDPSKPRYLVTEPWIGYRFNPTGVLQ